MDLENGESPSGETESGDEDTMETGNTTETSEEESGDGDGDGDTGEEDPFCPEVPLSSDCINCRLQVCQTLLANCLNNEACSCALACIIKGEEPFEDCVEVNNLPATHDPFFTCVTAQSQCGSSCNSIP